VVGLRLPPPAQRTSRREDPLDAQTVEPTAIGAGGIDPEQEALLADSVGLALLVVLETLAPAERLAFVLHDMFGVSFDEIAPIVGRSSVATRQLASRARRRIQADAATPDANGTPTSFNTSANRRRSALSTGPRWRVWPRRGGERMRQWPCQRT
jgi:hypothetical protein